MIKLKSIINKLHEKQLNMFKQKNKELLDKLIDDHGQRVADLVIKTSKVKKLEKDYKDNTGPFKGIGNDKTLKGAKFKNAWMKIAEPIVKKDTKLSDVEKKVLMVVFAEKIFTTDKDLDLLNYEV